MLIKALKYGMAIFGILALFIAVFAGAIQLLGVLGALIGLLLICSLGLGACLAYEEGENNVEEEAGKTS